MDKEVAMVVGAQVDSRRKLAEAGIGAPSSKRFSLSWIAANANSFPSTTDALHSSLVGGLVSAFCFRRCSMAILDELFKVVPASELNAQKPMLRPLSRKAADELILSTVLWLATSRCLFILGSMSVTHLQPEVLSASCCWPGRLQNRCGKREISRWQGSA